MKLYIFETDSGGYVATTQWSYPEALDSIRRLCKKSTVTKLIDAYPLTPSKN